MKYLGFDIGGTKSAVILADENAKIIKKEKFPTSDPKTTIEKLFSIAESFNTKFDGIGFSCGGPLDEKRGVILSPPNLPGWDNIPIIEMTEKRFGIKANIKNDANACALAEWRFGAGKGSKNMAFLTFGTGLGAGLILNGKLYEGTNGNAGEIGHIRLSDYGPCGYGKIGSMEGFVSGAGLAQLGISLANEQFQQGNNVSYCTRETIHSLTAADLANAARKGDKIATRAFDICGEMLGRGLSVLVDILNLERIVIGSVFARCEDLLCPSMNKAMQKECLPTSLDVVQVKPALLGEAIGDIAAICVAME